MSEETIHLSRSSIIGTISYTGVKYLFLQLECLNPRKLLTGKGPAVRAAPAACPSPGRKRSAPVWCAEFLIREVDV